MTTTTPVAGWYPDPLAEAGHRYWDGAGWTEHTSPAVALEPAPAPAPAPAQPTQPVPPVPVQSVQVAPVPQPYAYQPGTVRVAHGRPVGLYPYRPPRRSTGINVLIGLAIAFGVVVLVGILAAIAIPVFLNQRAKAQEAAAPETSSSGHTTSVAMPDTAAGLVRSRSAVAQQLTKSWLALPIPGTRSVGVYDDANGRTRAAILASRVDMTASDQADFARGTQFGSARAGVSAFHQVAPGRLGGRVQCAAIPSGNATICFFVDGHVGGMVDVFGTTSGDALAVHLREAVEHLS